MRVLIVTTTYPPHLNGQATFSGNLANGLAARGHAVRVVVPQRGWKLEVEEHGNLSVWRVPGLPLSLLRNELIWVWRLSAHIRQVFEEFQPEVVHLQDSSPLCRAALKEARRRGIPVLATHHPGPEIWAPYFSWLARYFRPLVAWIAWRWMLSFLNCVDGVVVPSEAAAQVLHAQKVRPPVEVISCGVDWHGWQALPPVDRVAVRQAWGLPPDQPVFLYVGRLDPEKRLPVLLEAAALVHGSAFQVVLAGEGGQEHQLRRWVNAQRLQERVRFLGRVPREAIAPLLQAADIFVMPGDVESLSLATLEAMACGKPVIAARAMALPELVRHGLSGRLFQPGEAGDLAAQMQWMLEHPEAWAVMGAHGRQVARAHDLNRTLTHYEGLYERMALPAGVPAPTRRPWVRGRVARLSPARALAVILIALSALFLSDMYRAPAASASGLSLSELRTTVIEHLGRLFEHRLGEGRTTGTPNYPWQSMERPIRVALFTQGGGMVCPPLIMDWQPLPAWLAEENPSDNAVAVGALMIVESNWDTKQLQIAWQPQGCQQMPVSDPAAEQSLLQSYKSIACQAVPTQEDSEALQCALQVLESWMHLEVTP